MRLIEEPGTRPDYTVDGSNLLQIQYYREAVVGMGLLAIEIVSEQSSEDYTEPAPDPETVEQPGRAGIDADILT